VVGDGSAAYVLPAIRSLARAGFSVGVGQPARGLATASRACGRYHPIPRAEDDLERWLATVAQVVRTGGYDVVFPADDIELLALSASRDRVPAVVPYPAHAVVLEAVDKLSLTSAAVAAGLGAPATGAATPAAVAAVDRPVVVKARLHWAPEAAETDRHVPVRVASTPAEAEAAVAAMRAAGAEPVLQELVDGALMAVSAVVDAHGQLVAYSQQETERTTLRRTSARARTVAADPDLEAGVTALLRTLGWCGLANLQFLRPAGGPPRLIDFNARFYGSLALAVAAGADLPAAWAAVALGDHPNPVARSRPGVRFQALDEDLLTVRRGGRPRALATVEALRYATGAAHSVWDARDPGPALQRFAERSARLAGRLGPSASARLRH